MVFLVRHFVIAHFYQKKFLTSHSFPYPDGTTSVCSGMFKNTVQTHDIVITAFSNNNSNASKVAPNAFSEFLLNASENGHLFVPWELKSNVTCPDTWERYDI